MRKTTTILLFALTALGFVFTGCPTDAQEDTRHSAYGSPPYTGPVNGEASDYHQGGAVKIIITLALEDGYITNVNFDGSSGNTSGIGSRVIDNASAEIVAKNSVEIDRVSGATVTRNTVIAAGKAALMDIPGYTPE
jgi:fumarate reductase flavoprotein subunit